MFLKSVFALFAVLMMGASAFANDNQPQRDRRQPRYDQQWVCSAHGVYSGRAYQGRASNNQHQAKESAHQACEYYEGECSPNGCQVVYGGGQGGGHGGGGHSGGNGNRW